MIELCLHPDQDIRHDCEWENSYDIEILWNSVTAICNIALWKEKVNHLFPVPAITPFKPPVCLRHWKVSKVRGLTFVFVSTYLDFFFFHYHTIWPNLRYFRGVFSWTFSQRSHSGDSKPFQTLLVLKPKTFSLLPRQNHISILDHYFSSHAQYEEKFTTFLTGTLCISENYFLLPHFHLLLSKARFSLTSFLVRRTIWPLIFHCEQRKCYKNAKYFYSSNNFFFYLYWIMSNWQMTLFQGNGMPGNGFTEISQNIGIVVSIDITHHIRSNTHFTPWIQKVLFLSRFPFIGLDRFTY